tara:strand:- start:412 stop:669 length:258 start_codon:yes stop_codon:yes gene_type:complete
LALSAIIAATWERWTCRLRQTFFGLTREYQEGVYEELFVLKHHGGWSIFEAYNLPTQLRRWFVKRLVKEFEDQNKEMEKSSRAAK